MNCERIREQIPEALAGRLDKTAREALVEHLEGCANCRTEVAELNAVWRGLETVKSGMDATPDPGAKVEIAGRNVELPIPPGGFARLGISFVHQHLGLVPTLTVLENLLVADIAVDNRWALNYLGDLYSPPPEMLRHRRIPRGCPHVRDLCFAL